MLTTLLLCSSLTLAAAPAVGDQIAEARAHIEAGEASRALELLDRMLAQGEGVERDVRLLLADAQLASGRPDAAVETLAPVAVGADHDALLAMGLAFKAYAEQMTTQRRSNDDVGFAYDEARAYLGLAADAASASDGRAATALGNIELYVVGDHDAALQLASALLERISQDGEALLLRGCAGLFASIAKAEAGDEEAAKKARRAAVDDLLAANASLPKDRVDPWVQLAWLYEVMDQPDAAVGAAVTVIKRSPEASFKTIYHLARRYSSERRFGPASEALAAMTRADSELLGKWIVAEADRTVAAVELSWAVMPLLDRSPDMAREVLAALVAVYPKNADIWNNYAFVCRDTRKLDESIKAYRQALKIEPDNPRLMNDTALILHYYLKQDLPEAAELYEQAAEIAKQRLEAEGLDAEQRAMLEEVLRDAKNNLTKLAAGDYVWN